MAKFFNKNLLFFLIFFCFYLTLALWLVFYHERVFQQFDIIFGTDCLRVMQDFCNIKASHSRVNAHPFLLIQMQPVFSFISGIVRSTHAAALIIQAFISAANVCLLKSTVYNFTQNKKISLLCSLIFGFSFSTLMFTILPENYVFSAFFGILLLHYVSIKLKDEQKLSIKALFVMALLSMFSFGIIPLNLVQCLILIIYLLIKKIGFNKEFALKLLILFGFILALFFGLSLIQKGCYPFCPIFFKGTMEYDVPKFLDFSTNHLKLQWLLRGVLVEPFYPSKCVMDAIRPDNAHYFFSVDYQNFLRFIPAICFWLMPLGYFLKTFKENTNRQIAFLSFLIIILNALFCFSYDTKECFLFSQNYMMFYILFLGAVIANFKGKFFKVVCSLFLIFQISAAFYQIYDIHKWLLRFGDKPANLILCFVYSLIVALIIVCFGYITKKIIKKEFLELPVDKKYFFYSSAYLIYIIICAVFVALFHAKGV